MLKANSLCSNEQLCVISYKDDISEINSMYVQLTFIYLKGLYSLLFLLTTNITCCVNVIFQQEKVETIISLSSYRLVLITVL